MTVLGGIVALALLALSAIFAASETALLGAASAPGEPDSPPRLERERLLPGLLLGSTLANVGFASIAAAWGSVAGPPGGLLTTVSIVTLLLFVLGELLPREVGRRRGAEWLRGMAGSLDRVAGWLAPLAQLLNRASRIVLLLVGLDPRELHPRVPPQDLRFLFRTGAGAGLVGLGPLSPTRHHDLHSLFDFSRTAVREVMIPLTDVKALPATSRVSDVLELARRTQLTRVPVFGARLDEILGIVNVYDILYSEFEPRDSIRRFMRPGLYVPNTVAMDKLLVQMQSRKAPLAVVVDEFGGADGIVTVKDVVEEVVGTFYLGDQVLETPIQRQGEGGFLLDGHISLDRLNRELGLELPKRNYETLAGFLMTEMEKIPEEGDRFTFQNLTFTVSKAKRHTLQKVQLRIRR